MNTQPWRPSPGDLVKLKSGGPKMTVGECGTEHVTCQWFDTRDNNTLLTGEFHPSQLIRVE